MSANPLGCFLQTLGDVIVNSQHRQLAWRRLLHPALHHLLGPLVVVLAAYYSKPYFAGIPHKPAWLPEYVAHFIFHNAWQLVLWGLATLIALIGLRYFVALAGSGAAAWFILPALGARGSVATVGSLLIAVIVGLELVFGALAHGSLTEAQEAEDEFDASESPYYASFTLVGFGKAFHLAFFRTSILAGVTLAVVGLVIAFSVAWFAVGLTQRESMSVALGVFLLLTVLWIVAFGLSRIRHALNRDAEE